MLSVIPTINGECNEEQHECMFPATLAVSPSLELAGQTLVDYAQKYHGVAFRRLESASQAAVAFHHDSTLASGAYAIRVKPERVTVMAAELTGAQNAVSTLIQLMKKSDGGLTLPVADITDAPECSWRGLMIDLARIWHEPHYMFDYVDLCRYYKINILHLHFTDDQSYTLPSQSFPKLSTPKRSYSVEIIRQLVAYARLRGVQLIPEIDVPGHATSFKTYGDSFGTDGIICQNPQSMTAMKTLFTELCELFPDSDYIHIGGDEAEIAKWTECPRCLEVFKARGIDVEHTDKKELMQIMYATFIKDIAETVTACGKTPVVWEGTAKCVNYLIPKNTVVISWENYYQYTWEIQEAGFRMINCTWSPLYIVPPDTYWSPEEIFNWDVCSWRPTHPQSPYRGKEIRIEPTTQLEGAQLAVWGSSAIGKYASNDEENQAEWRLTTERLPMLAENTWNRTKRTTWQEFSARLAPVDRLLQGGFTF